MSTSPPTLSPAHAQSTTHDARRQQSVSDVSILTACARPKLRPQDAELLSRASHSGVDWGRVTSLAIQHGVLPLLHHHMTREFGASVPAGCLSAMRPESDSNAARNLISLGEIRRLLNALQKESIPVIPLKGPLLAAALYGSFALRRCNDIDLLVRSSDVRRARRALEDAGYQFGHQLSERQAARYLDIGSEFLFYAPSGQLVELQWRMVPRQFSFDYAEDFLWTGVRPTVSHNFSYLDLSPENLMLFLCVHGGKHMWNRILWIADVAALVEVDPPDWDTLLKRARDVGALRLCLLGLHLASRFLGSRLPAEVTNEIAADPTVEVLASQVASKFLSPSYTTSEAHRFAMATRERRLDRTRYAWRTTFTPALGEWEKIELPGPLFPLYHAVRLARLVTKPFARRSNT